MIDFVPPENLAPFSLSESHMLQQSIDFLGLNYYTTNYVSYDSNAEGEGYNADQKLEFHHDKNGIPIGDPSGSSWLYVVPWGIYEHLIYIKKKYGNLLPIYITENGVSDKNDYKLTAKEACADSTRVKYHRDHLANVLRALNEGKVNVKGYFVWSWCDNFEWAEGYKVRFGITYVDYMNNQTRYPKDSALWFAKFLRSKHLDLVPLSNKSQIEKNSDNEPEERMKAAEE